MVEPVSWAVGGTDRITVDFPGDDLFDNASACAVELTPMTTAGPCYFDDATGEDIAEGLSGLPMQLCLQVIDSDCLPVEDYVVEVWHCDHRGVYSADTSESVEDVRFLTGFCTGGDEAALSSTWYRGRLRTDTNGRVNFKTCFPGWYASRTIHIHFSVADPLGNNQVISQFCFTDALAEEICTTHEVYAERGVQDTPLASAADIVFPSEGFEPFLFNTAQNTDGSLLAYHRIQIV